MTMDIGFDIKKLFFDTKAVRGSVDKATRRALSKFGAFVRKSSRSSIRIRKAVSRPGAPPSSHTGLLKRLILFGYDPRKRSVVIGPVRFTRRAGGEAPSLLEYGGRGTVTRFDKKKRATWSPRPFMGPAMEKEKSKLPAIWRDSVK